MHAHLLDMKGMSIEIEDFSFIFSSCFFSYFPAVYSRGQLLFIISLMSSLSTVLEEERPWE